jgi:hypothetical protein
VGPGNDSETQRRSIQSLPGLAFPIRVEADRKEAVRKSFLVQAVHAPALLGGHKKKDILSDVLLLCLSLAKKMQVFFGGAPKIKSKPAGRMKKP